MPAVRDTAIQKMPSAPAPEPRRGRRHRRLRTRQQKQAVVTGDPAQALQAAWLKLARRIVAKTEDVGERFADEARNIHYGETEERGIRGQASPRRRPRHCWKRASP